MVAVDCRPLSVLDSKIASHWQHVATGGFWNGIRHDAVGTELQRILGVEIKPALKKLLASADRVAITTDFWTAPQTAGSYAGVTAHFFVETDRDIRLHRAVLAFDLMQGMQLSHGSMLHPDSGRVGCVVRVVCVTTERHTAQNIGAYVHGVLKEWNVLGKLFAATTDGASNQRKAMQSHVNGEVFWTIWCSVHRLNLVIKDGLKVRCSLTG